jgi:ubiquinone biosynthesis protein
MDRRFFRIGPSDLNRLRRILVVVFEAGGGALIDRLRLRYYVPLRYRIRGLFKRQARPEDLIRIVGVQPIVSPPVLRSVLEKLGPTFIKLGQVLSLRADVVGEELAEELSKLQSDAPPFHYEEARLIFKEETGRFPEEVFKSLEEKPVAAASLAQVHRGLLKDGTEVAVKIQRPGIQKIILQDIHLLYFLAGLAERFLPEFRTYQPNRIVREFADWTLRELNFVVEGQNAERFRNIFQKNPDIYIPKVFWELTAPRVLTMEYVHGIKVSDLPRIKTLGLDTKRLASIGIEALFRQFLIDGFFHADPHPGNFFVLPDGRLCLHDFGMVGFLDQSARKELLSCLIAFVNKDIEGFTRHILHMAWIDEKSDVGGFRKDISNILSEFFFSQRHPSVAWSFFRVINRGARNGIRFPTDHALFGKAIVTTEAMGLKLHPELDLNEELAPFVKKALREHLSPRKAFRTLQADFLDHLNFMSHLPERIQNVLNKIEKGEIGVKMDTEDLQGIKREFDRQNDLRLLGLVLTAVFLATFGLLYLEGITAFLGIPFSRLGMALFAVLSVWFLYKLRQGPLK